MEDIHLFSLILICTLILSTKGFSPGCLADDHSEDELTISQYNATYSFDGTLTESYIYDLKADNTYQSLNRVFSIPVSKKPSEFTNISLISLSIPKGTHAYLKDYQGRIYISPPDITSYEIIQKKAHNNEAGALKPGYYRTGLTEVRYTWLLSPTIQRGDDADYLHITLATGHIPYSNISITIPADGINEIHAYPITMRINQTGDQYQITGSAAEDEPLGFELILKRGTGYSRAGRMEDLVSVNICDTIHRT